MGRKEPLSAPPPPNPPRSLLYKLEKAARVTSEKPARGQHSPWEWDAGPVPGGGTPAGQDPPSPCRRTRESGGVVGALGVQRGGGVSEPRSGQAGLESRLV